MAVELQTLTLIREFPEIAGMKQPDAHMLYCLNVCNKPGVSLSSKHCSALPEKQIGTSQI